MRLLTLLTAKLLNHKFSKLGLEKACDKTAKSPHGTGVYTLYRDSSHEICRQLPQAEPDSLPYLGFKFASLTATVSI